MSPAPRPISDPNATHQAPTHPGSTWPDIPETTFTPAHPGADATQDFDVAVVGAGIAGITSAYLLALEGKAVLLLDDSGAISGESRRTSAHLASALDDRFYVLERTLGQEASRLAYEIHASAIDFIEATCAREQISCDFHRLDAYLFLGPDDSPATLDKEFDAARRTGIEVERLESIHLTGFHTGPCLRFGKQARFQPLQYLVGLLRRCEAMGVRFELESRVIDVKATSDDSPAKVQTADGRTFRAGSVIVATNTPSPINDWLGIYLKQSPYRTYMLALEIDPATLADALYWDTPDPYHYVRLDTAHEPPLLLVGGEDHKVGQPPPGGEATCYDRLDAFARRCFPSAGRLVAAWSGQVQEPSDHLGYLGLAPTASSSGANPGNNVYCITGDSGMGLTHGTLGARLCTDLIMGRHNPYAALYSPTRKPAAASTVAEFVSENANVARQYTHLLAPGEIDSPDDLPPGTGGLLRQGLQLQAVYKTLDGAVRKCSAICPHLGCAVHWNDVEKSWDCPCHGSRFASMGDVLIGPAVTGLSPIDDEEPRPLNPADLQQGEVRPGDFSSGGGTP